MFRIHPVRPPPKQWRDAAAERNELDTRLCGSSSEEHTLYGGGNEGDRPHACGPWRSHCGVERMLSDTHGSRAIEARPLAPHPSMPLAQPIRHG